MQRGEIKRLGDSWAWRARIDGRRKQKGGFATKGEAQRALHVVLERERKGFAIDDVTSFRAYAEQYLRTHEADPVTLDHLRHRLARAFAAFGDKPLGKIWPAELREFRASLPDTASRHYIFRAVRQIFRAALADRILEFDPTIGIANPVKKAKEIEPFQSWAEVEAVAAELAPEYAAIPIFAAGTGMRPEEWIALRWAAAGEQTATIARVYAHGRLKEAGKTGGSLRRVPLRAKVLFALERHRVVTPGDLVFPGARGQHLNLSWFRNQHWKPALIAAGLPPRRIYDLRHTFATFALAGPNPVSLYQLARVMGTSVRMIEATYGHLLPDAEEHLRERFDAFDGEEAMYEALPDPAKERLFAKGEIDLETGCWIWKGYTSPKGYGITSWGGKSRQVHRLAAHFWLDFDLDSEEHVIHSCDRPPCFNPAHLRIGTNADNVRDRHEKGRTAVGEAHGQAKLTTAQVIEIKRRLLAGVRQNEIAAAFGVSDQLVSDIARGKSWRHVFVTTKETAKTGSSEKSRKSGKALYPTRTGDPLLTMPVGTMGEDAPDSPEPLEMAGDEYLVMGLEASGLLAGSFQSTGAFWALGDGS